MSLARTERAALADLLEEVGPDAPTLCEGWLTRDLAAHIVIRERRPDAGIGIVVPALAGRTKSVQKRAAERPFPELVAQVRSGPPFWNPMRLGPVEESVNGFEFLVHHEDVRRARAGWSPRPLPEQVQDQVWARLDQTGRVAYRKAPVGVLLRRPDGRNQVARAGEPLVTITGDPVELVMHAFGRSACRVDIQGDAPAVAALAASRRGF